MAVGYSPVPETGDIARGMDILILVPQDASQRQLHRFAERVRPPRLEAVARARGPARRRGSAL